MATLVVVTRRAAVRYYARWRLLDGTFLDTDLTAGAYAALGSRGAGSPARTAVPAGAVWVHAAGGVVTWNTGDGKLAFGQYEALADGRYVLGLERSDPITIKVTSGDILTESSDFRVDGLTYRLTAGTVVRV